MKKFFTPATVVSLVFLSFVLVAVVAPGWIAPYDPLAVDINAAMQAPEPAHPFGTDQTGRDVFSRVVYGAGASIGIGVLATLIALVGGLLLGTLIAIAPRVIDAVLMRLVDVLLAVPEFVVALIVLAMLGPGITNIAIAVTVSVVPVYIRLARVHTRSLRDAEHVRSARLLGVGRFGVISRHVLPAVLSRLSVLATIGVGSAILSASGLSFLGLGAVEPAPEWGLMLAGGRNVLGQAWWIAVFPGLSITGVVLATSVIGRRLRQRNEAV